MKYFKYVYIILAFVAISCNRSDDQFYNTVYIEAPGLIDLNRKPFYELNDSVTFTITIPNLLQGQGYDLPVNIYETTKTPYLLIGYHIEKWIDNDWFIYQVFDMNFTAPITLGNDNYYRGRHSIGLTEIGSYRLIFGEGYKKNQIGLRSKNTSPNPTISISTTALNYGDGYIFSVR
jgi:hypothetical protein